MVVDQVRDGKHLIVIGTNRIERVAAQGAATAAQSKEIERRASCQALAGLRDARARIMTDPTMTAKARCGALDGMDESIMELEADLATPTDRRGRRAKCLAAPPRPCHHPPHPPSRRRWTSNSPAYRRSSNRW